MYRPTGDTNHPPRIADDEAEDIPVDLLLDRVEGEAPLRRDGVMAMRIHEDCQVLVDAVDCENVAVPGALLMQERDGVAGEFDGAAPQQASAQQRRLPFLTADRGSKDR